MKKLLLPIYLWLHRTLLKICWNVFSLFPLNPQKAVFSNFNGGVFGDNPKYIVEEFLRRGLDWKLYWTSASDYKLPKGVLPVRPNTVAFVWHMSTASTWVDNTRKLYYVKKRPGQFYIHTRHGGPGPKKIEGDCEELLSKEYVAYAKIDSKNIDLMLSTCKWQTQLLKRAFWYDGPVFEKGQPKYDVYFRDQNIYRKKVQAHFHLPEDTRFVTYAPTFRESRNTDMYNLNYEQLLDTMAKRFGGSWAVRVCLHPNVDRSKYVVHYTDRILNPAGYGDMQELLAASDAIISDYSGCTTEFAMLGRPGFLYIEDYESAKKERGYYYDLTELPFPLTFSNEELMHAIETFDEAAYESKCEKFRSWMQFYEGGIASAAVVDLILEHAKECSNHGKHK